MTTYADLLSGTYWHAGGANITYSFLGTPPDYYPGLDIDGDGTDDARIISVSGTPSNATLDEIVAINANVSLNSAQQAAAQSAITRWNEVANINLTPVAVTGASGTSTPTGTPVPPGNTLVSGLGGPTGYGEIEAPRNDDGFMLLDSTQVSAVFETGLNFFGTTYDSFYVNTNGSIYDRGNGDFDIVYRYQDINWSAGDASGGSGGLGGTAAHAGWTAGNGTNYFELPQSGDEAAILDLENIAGNTGLPGFWVFQVRNGEVSIGDVTFAAYDAYSSDGTSTGTPALPPRAPLACTMPQATCGSTTTRPMVGATSWRVPLRETRAGRPSFTSSAMDSVSRIRPGVARTAAISIRSCPIRPTRPRSRPIRMT